MRFLQNCRPIYSGEIPNSLLAFCVFRARHAAAQNCHANEEKTRSPTRGVGHAIVPLLFCFLNSIGERLVRRFFGMDANNYDSSFAMIECVCVSVFVTRGCWTQSMSGMDGRFRLDWRKGRHGERRHHYRRNGSKCRTHNVHIHTEWT